MAIILSRIEQYLFQDVFQLIKYFNLIRELLDRIFYYCVYRKVFTNVHTTITNTSLYPPNSTLIILSENHLENLLIDKRAISPCILLNI